MFEASPFPAAGPGFTLQVLAASCFGGSGLSAAIPLAAAVQWWALETISGTLRTRKDGKGLHGTGQSRGHGLKMLIHKQLVSLNTVVVCGTSFEGAFIRLFYPKRHNIN
jgi:hypothetical protein